MRKAKRGGVNKTKGRKKGKSLSTASTRTEASDEGMPPFHLYLNAPRRRGADR